MSETDIALIELVEQYKHIYDKKNKLHKDKLAVQNAWESIAKVLNIPGPACQHRWEILRNRYSKERKALPTRLGTNSKKEWPCFKALQFLQDIVIPRKRFGCIANISNEGEMCAVDPFLNTDVAEPITMKIEDSDASTSEEPTTMPSEHFLSSPCKYVDSNSNFEEQLNNDVNTFTEYISTKNTNKTEQDSDMMFCMSLYESFRNIKDNKQKNKAKIAVLSALDEFLND